MLVAAAFCPHPPLLVPGVGSGAGGELDDLRAACDAAVRDLVGLEADLLVVVGGAPTVGPLPERAWGSLRPYGVDVEVSRGDGAPRLPLSLTVARWLLDRVGSALPTLMFGVVADSPPDRCRHLGEALGDRAARVSMLVMGDGSARRSRKGPGFLDERAEGLDATVAEALGRGDVAALAGLDPVLAADLLVAGRAPWQVLAGAADPGTWRGDLTYDASPYGVTYLVAGWRPRG